MDADELLRSDAPFVADTPAWWRAATLPDDLGSLLQGAVLEERFWITPIVRAQSVSWPSVPTATIACRPPTR